jgi:thymidylate synthase (FAD)
MDVELRDSMGSDDSILRAMLVSTNIDDIGDREARKGRINFLMKNRHGSPFEHGSMTFYVEAPVFVFREFMRHRIGFSYNEMSGRYTELEPVFYTPGWHRPLVQTGKPGAYEMVPGDDEQKQLVAAILRRSYVNSWYDYRMLLDSGVAKELARSVLPVGIYSKMYVTCNPRSMMAFLSLRTDNPMSMFPSKPQYEIVLVAAKMELAFAKLYPLTYAAFCNNGRVSP